METQFIQQTNNNLNYTFDINSVYFKINDTLICNIQLYNITDKTETYAK